MKDVRSCFEHEMDKKKVLVVHFLIFPRIILKEVAEPTNTLRRIHPTRGGLFLRVAGRRCFQLAKLGIQFSVLPD